MLTNLVLKGLLTTRKRQLFTRWLWLLLMAVTRIFPAVVAAENGQGEGLLVQAIPSTDGQEVWVWANPPGTAGAPISGVLCDSVCGSCRTMNCTGARCSATLNCFPPEMTVEGQMSIAVTLSSTQILDSGSLPFVRAFVPAVQLANLVTPDNLLELTVFPDTLPADTYIFSLAASALPGPLPPNHHLVGRLYDIRASGALVQSNQSMSLHLAYDPLLLENATPHNLSIFAWDPTSQSWLEKGGTLFSHQNYLSRPIQRFTTYVLLEVPAWRDTFADTSGLAATNSTLPTPDEGLILSSGTVSGTAFSNPIIPTTSMASWGQVIFAVTTSATTALKVDVLSSDGVVLRSNVTSGESLGDIDSAIYPALVLRGTLLTTVPGDSPRLKEWRVTWLPNSHKIFLPTILKGTKYQTSDFDGVRRPSQANH